MRLVEESGNDPLAAIIDKYLSHEHRNRIGDGCIFPALGADAVRQGPELIRSFEAGIRAYLDVIERAMQISSTERARKDSTVVLSTMVGALLLSRLVEDEALSSRILDQAIASLLERDNPSESGLV